jgi:hypothetical protein
VIFTKFSRSPLLPIHVLEGETNYSAVMKKSSSIPYPEGNVLMVLIYPEISVGSPQCRGH